nr:hypothetical protein [Tanacetum cinerariifolium]
MSTKQDIYAAGSENRPPMLNKYNYVPWSSCIIRYARSRPNGKMIVDSIDNGPYVRRMIATPGEPDLPVPVPKSFHEHTDEELTKNDIKRIDADDQAIQTILLGLPEDVYAAADSCETAKKIWERVRQMMKENIAANLKFLNNLQPEWKRYVTIVRQTKNLHEVNLTQIYDFLKMNQDEDRQIQNVGGNGGNQFGQYAGQLAQNQQGYNAWQNYGIQVAKNVGQNAVVQNGEEFDFMAAAGDLDKIEEVNANYILMANLQHASTSGTQLDKARVYDTDGSAEVQLNDNCYDNEIFNMFTQEEQCTDLLEPIPEPQLVPKNDNHVTLVAPSMEYKYLDKEVDLETKIKDLENIPHKRDQAVQTMHMLNPKPDLFYHPDQKMALGYPNLSYLKKAQLKQQSLYNGNLLLEEHNPPVVFDSEETLELAQERFFVPQMTKSKEELFLSNALNMVTISKTMSIPNEDFSDDTTPSVARKFLNEVKNSLVTLQPVVKQKMTLEVHNWSSSAHKKAKAIATACYTQNDSIIHLHFNKTPYELNQGRKLDISYLYVFEALCYPKNDLEDISKLNTKDSALTPTNSSNTLISSHNVDEQSQPHAQKQGDHTPLPTASAANDVPNAVFEGDLFVYPFATPSTESVVSLTQYVDP